MSEPTSKFDNFGLDQNPFDTRIADEEIASRYISYTKACLLVYVRPTRRGRRKARKHKRLKQDTLAAALEVHSCRECDTKKALDSLKIVIEEGRISYECKTCPSTSSSPVSSRNPVLSLSYSSYS